MIIINLLQKKLKDYLKMKEALLRVFLEKKWTNQLLYLVVTGLTLTVKDVVFHFTGVLVMLSKNVLIVAVVLKFAMLI